MRRSRIVASIANPTSCFPVVSLASILGARSILRACCPQRSPLRARSFRRRGHRRRPPLVRRRGLVGRRRLRRAHRAVDARCPRGAPRRGEADHRAGRGGDQRRARAGDQDRRARLGGQRAHGGPADRAERDHPRGRRSGDAPSRTAGEGEGARLDGAGSIAALQRLARVATLVTPNLAEAGALLGATITTEAQARDAAVALVEAGSHAALVKGGHGKGAEAVDWLVVGAQTKRLVRIARPRRKTPPLHGTGCTLASLIAGRLAARRRGAPARDERARRRRPLGARPPRRGDPRSAHHGPRAARPRAEAVGASPPPARARAPVFRLCSARAFSLARGGDRSRSLPLGRGAEPGRVGVARDTGRLGRGHPSSSARRARGDRPGFDGDRARSRRRAGARPRRRLAAGERRRRAARGRARRRPRRADRRASRERIARARRAALARRRAPAADHDGALVQLGVEIAAGKLRVTADVYPMPRSVWSKIRDPEPGPIAHAFAEAPIDAEVRATPRRSRSSPRASIAGATSRATSSPSPAAISITTAAWRSWP